MEKFKLEYIWLDGYEPVPNLRGKTKVMEFAQFPTLEELPLPLTNTTISNFGGSTCGGTLVESFVASCNTTFARLGLDLGEKFPPGTAQFGISSSPPLDESPRAVASQGPQAGTDLYHQVVHLRTDRRNDGVDHPGVGQEVLAEPLARSVGAMQQSC